MVPVVGVMVAATAAGTLVLVPSQESSADTVDAPDAGATMEPNPEVEIGEAVVQERNADGTPGEVVVRDD
jgi:hypothetical protein